jgi:hypothetical protein
VNEAAVNHSASGCFSGRARSKAASAWQALSTATILGNFSSGSIATGERGGLDQFLKRLEAGHDPMVIPGINRALLLTHGIFQVAQWAGIVKRMDVASDEFGERTHFGAGNRIFRKERRLGVRLLKIFDDGERLNQNFIPRCHENRHAHLRIYGAEFLPLIVAAILNEMDGRRIVGNAFEIERNAHAVGRRRTEVGIKLHASSIGPSCPPVSATSCADRSVICFNAR